MTLPREPEHNRCVHTEHCCILDGCKYNDENCPVGQGEKRQSHLCEDCTVYMGDLDFGVEESVERLIVELYEGRILLSVALDVKRVLHAISGVSSIGKVEILKKCMELTDGEA